MKKLLLIVFASTPCLAGGPNYGPNYTPANSDKEFQQVYHDIAFPQISTGTAQNFTVVNGSFTTMVGTTGFCSSCTVNNFTAVVSTMTNVKVTGIAVLPYITNWKNDLTFTPNNFGVTSSSVFWYRRVGDSMEVVFTFKAGTPAAGNATITLGGSLSYDTAKVTDAKNPFGFFHITSGAGGAGHWANGIGGAIYGVNSAPTTVFLSAQNGTDASGAIYNNLFASTLINTGGTMSGRFTVPISGWSANN